MKLMVIEGFVVPVSAPEGAGDLYEVDMDGMMVLLSAANAEKPKLLSVETGSFVDMDRDQISNYMAKVGDHPAMEIVAKMSAEYAEAQAKKADDVFAEFVTRVSVEKKPAVGKKK